MESLISRKRDDEKAEKLVGFLLGLQIDRGLLNNRGEEYLSDWPLNRKGADFDIAFFDNFHGHHSLIFIFGGYKKRTTISRNGDTADVNSKMPQEIVHFALSLDRIKIFLGRILCSDSDRFESSSPR
jgi:hypothetical protein